MSELLNLSNFFAESTCYNVLSEVRSGELYMESCLSLIQEFNKNFNESNKILYTKINEANDRACENDALCEYMKSIEKAVRDTNSKVNDIVSRFVIRIDNMIDADTELLNNIELLFKCKPFSYRYYKFKKIDDPSFPKMNPLSIYNKEFDFIGQLMQDLGPAASNQAKLGIIASVYNKLNEGGKHNCITKRCIKDILNDDCDINKFAHELYEEFKEEEPKDIMIDRSRLYDVKLSMTNYKNLVNSAVSSAENLVKQFDEIASRIKEVVIGNSKNNLKIDSPTDGIKNTTYKLDTYSMNQLDLFMKCKINQLTEMVNIYLIALSIKFDAIVEYFDQCKDILRLAEMNCCEDCSSSKDEEPEEVEIPSEDEGEESEEPDDDEDKENEDDSEDDEEKEDSEESEDEEKPEEDESDNEDDEYELGEMDDSDPMKPEEDSNPSGDESTDENTGSLDSIDLPDINDMKESCERFESEVRDYLYSINTLCSISENFDMIDNILGYVTEEDGGDSQPAQDQQQAGDAGKTDTGSDNKPDTIGKTKELVNNTKDSVWKAIVNRTAELWNKFKTNILGMYEERIKYLDSNKKYITEKPIDFSPDSKKLMPIIHEANLNIVLPDLNYGTMKKNLKDENTFFSTYFKTVKRKDGQTISEAVKNNIIDPDNYYINMNQLKPVELYEFCKTIPKKLDELSKNTQVMSRGRKNAEQIAKTIVTAKEESSKLEDTMAMYFNEGDYKSSKKEEKEKINNTSDDLNVYFKVCGTVLAAQMTCCQKIFKEYYQYLKFHIDRTSGGSKDSGNKEDGKTDTTDNNKTGGEGNVEFK